MWSIPVFPPLIRPPCTTVLQLGLFLLSGLSPVLLRLLSWHQAYSYNPSFTGWALLNSPSFEALKTVLLLSLVSRRIILLQQISQRLSPSPSNIFSLTDEIVGYRICTACSLRKCKAGRARKSKSATSYIFTMACRRLHSNHLG